MKFLIIVPRVVARAGQYYEFPLGLAYISAALKHDGFNVSCLNLNHYDVSPKKLIENSLKNDDVAMTGGLSVHYNQIQQVLETARPFAKTVLGGGILSSNPKVVFDDLKPDYGVLFEGEQTTVELAKCLESGEDVEKVQGIVHWKLDKPQSTLPRSPVVNIDAIPYADYGGLEASKFLDCQMTNDNHYFYLFDKPRVLPVISSRSCPYNCTFCFHPLGNKYRMRSLDNFFNEIDLLQRQFNINMIAVYDELFASNTERLKDFCARIKRTGLKWFAQVRVDIKLNDNLMRIMKDAGLVCLGFGLESACNRVLASMNKHVTATQMEHALELTRKHGIGIQGNFIFGDIEETAETARETLAWHEKHREYQIFLTPIYPYPGTQLYCTALQRGLIEDEAAFQKVDHPIVNLSKMNNQEYAELMRSLTFLNLITRRDYAAKILTLKKVERTIKGTVYDVEAECPYCHSTSHYARFNVDPSRDLDVEGCQTACRNCNQRFTLYFPSITSKLTEHFSLMTQYRAAAAKRKVWQKLLNL
jgi:anaerobic magnesium-protoporphyrin IX monomethyl ester cyclase